MRRDYHQDKRIEEIDEHDQPTEPMAQVVLSPSPADTPIPVWQDEVAQNGNARVSWAQPFEPSFPQQPVYPVRDPFNQQPAYPYPVRDPFNQQPAYPVRGPFNQQSANPVYPVLPPHAARNWNGQSYGESLTAQPPGSAQSRPAAPPQPHRSLFPSLVGAFFVMIQLLLLVDFLLELFGQVRTTSWGHIIYLIGNIFAQPFLLLLKNIPFPATMSKEFYTSLVILIAILIYGVLARILVRFFKALLHSR